ncbi:MAG TPA: GMC family oxidoreductase [Actinomycetota bacterium]
MSRAYDVLVIGSGFGGSVAALRLAEKGYRVGVLEAGRRFGPRDFAARNWNLRRYLWLPRLGLRGIQRLTLLRDALVLSGAGVGGGSLVYAGVLYDPPEPFWDDPGWPGVVDWRRELAPHYDQAKRMLGAAVNPFETPADHVLHQVAARLDASDTHRPTTVGVHFGEPGRRVPDPYFGGAGPTRAGCIGCGGCMVGCRFDAKNSLDRNYLWLAESLGAVIHPETEAVDVIPLPGGGYQVETRRPGSWSGDRRSFRAREVVFAAGVLGTLKLLLKLRGAGRLRGLSARLGHLVRTNSEVIVGAVARRPDVDYSTGVAITSSIQPEPDTHVQVVRYPRGSNFMGLIGTILVDRDERRSRQLSFLAQALRRPVRFARSLSAYRWSERSVILLVMQSRDNSLRLVLRGRRLTSVAGEGTPSPRYIPVANRAARLAAGIIGGEPAGALNEALLDVPVTAHMLGGARIGTSSEDGVIDPYHRVFGHAGLHVMDGSTIAANLGVNPALTITALAERACSFWPNAGEADPRPELGRYEHVASVPSRRTAVPEGAPASLFYEDGR